MKSDRDMRKYSTEEVWQIKYGFIAPLYRILLVSHEELFYMLMEVNKMRDLEET